MNGVILVNKEKGKTSRDMVNELNHIFGIKKIGHTGTLDPLATGLLVMCLGKYTKLTEMLSSFKKTYIAEIKIGIKTDTLDITGNILEEKNCCFKKEDVIKVLSSLKGKITQEIPMYSAKKINGKKLYEYARENISITPIYNEIEVFNIKLLDIKDDIITFESTVSKGCYIRSLIQIICDKLSVIGCMNNLVRTAQDKFLLKDSYTIQDIKEGNYKLLNTEDLFPYPVYNLTKEEYKYVKNGNKIKLKFNDLYLVLKYDDKEIAIYIKDNDLYRPYVMLL